MRRPATQRRQKAEVPLPPPAAALAAQSGVASHKSQILGWLLAVMVVLGTMAVYWPATRGGFINYDDDLLVTANPEVQKGLTGEGMELAWFHPVNCLWHPVTVMSHMLDCQLFGLNPWGHHLTSVLLHGLNAGLIFALLQQMTGATWRSLLVAALFAVHPLRVESVAWVAERRGVLSGFFGLLALMAYARYARGKSEGRRPKPEGNPKAEGRDPKPEVSDRGPFSHLPSSNFYLLSLGFFACGLMSKPTIITLPCVMLLLDYWPLGRMKNEECSDTQHAPRDTLHVLRSTLFRLVREKLPFLALVAVSSVVTFVVQMRAGALAPIEVIPLGVRIGNALISYCLYLGKLFWPTDLAVLYPHPMWAIIYQRSWHLPLGQVVLAGGLLLGISALVWVLRQRHPCLLVGWLWYCGTLVPVSQLIQTGTHGMADRYTYLPSLGMMLLAVWGAYELMQGKSEIRSPNGGPAGLLSGFGTRISALFRASGFGLRISYGAGCAAIVLCMALTRQQIGYWRDTEALFRHAREVTKNNYAVPANLGIVYSRRGQLDEAIREYREALRLNPFYALAHYNLGNALFQKGQVDEAIQHYQESIRLLPMYVEPYNNLGLALAQKGQTDEAIRQFKQAVHLKPDDADVHYNLGAALGRRGQLDEAIRHYEEALRLKPDRAEAHNNLGAAFYKQGRTAEAIRHFQEALRLQPDYGDARRNLNAALAARQKAE
jgi:protein O-mannosyl-transferase